MMWLVVLLMFVTTPALALDLLCPYDVTGPASAFERRSLPHRLVAELRADQGKPPDRGNPWTEDEIAGSTRTSANIALITLPDQTNPGLRNSLVAQGCSDKPVDFLPRAARVPKVEGGVLTYDDRDPTRPIINPHKQRSASLPMRFARTLAPSLQWLWEANPFYARLAYAIGAFPDTAIIDNFNRSENPLAAPWFAFDAAEGDGFQANGTVAVSITGGASMYYSRMTALDADAHITMAVVAGNMDIFIKAQETGTSTNDGYFVRMSSSTNAVKIFRQDNGAATQLGTDVTQVEGNGDKLGIRRVGTAFSSYYVDISVAGTWNLLDTQTDSTYSGIGFPGMHTSNTTGTVDDFGFTVLPQALSLGYKLLK